MVCSEWYELLKTNFQAFLYKVETDTFQIAKK